MKINIEKELKEYDEETNKILEGIEDKDTYIKSFRMLGRAMLEFKLTVLNGWIKACESIREKGRKKINDK